MHVSLPIAGFLVCVFTSCTLMNGATLRQELAAEYLELADAYADVERYDKAALFYERAAQHKNYHAITRYKLARVYALSGKWQEAVMMLEPLHVQDPENLLISNAYAFALLSAGEKEKALPIYEKNYTENVLDPVQSRNYTEMLFLAERYQDALNMIQKLREDYGDAEYLTDLADLEKRITTAMKEQEAAD